MESIVPMLIAFLPKDIRSMFFPYASVQLVALLLNLVLGFFIASIIGLHFRRYASAFCNRQDFSRLFPLLMLSVILIITVVKASLALALGLVGALSIVRFRTPIKEPEELLYLFLNIGVAVALGAGQTLAAILACLVTLMLVTWAKQRQIALSLLNDFIDKKRSASDVFDAKRLSQYLATVDLWGAWHALTWNNWRWYYNPHTAKLEPIQSDVAVTPAAHIWLMRPTESSF